MKRIVTLVVAALLLAGCGMSSYESNRDEATLRYGNGFTEDKNFKGVVPPGVTNDVEFFTDSGDDLYKYPRSKRSWIASTTIAADGSRTTPPQADRPAYECVTSDEVRMLVDVAGYFTLNTTGLDDGPPDGTAIDEWRPPLRQFHEQIGLNRLFNNGRATGGFGNDVWRDVLNVYFDTPIEREIVDICGDYESDALRSNNVTRGEFGRKITSSVTAAIEESLGGRYFCGPEVEGNQCGDIVFEVGRPELVNRKIVEAEEAKRIAAADLEAQEGKNKVVDKELEATRNEIEALGAENFVMLEAIRSGNVQFMQLPPNASLTVPRGGN